MGLQLNAFHYCEEMLRYYPLHFFFHFLFSCEMLITFMLTHLILSQSSENSFPYSVFSPNFLCFTWGNLYWPVSKFTDYFFGCVESRDVSTGVIFHLYHLFFISSISTWLCVSTITLLKFFTCSPHWNFYVRAFILLILVILNYLSDGSNIELHISIVILFGFFFFFFFVKPGIMQDWVVPWL